MKLLREQTIFKYINYHTIWISYSIYLFISIVIMYKAEHLFTNYEIRSHRDYLSEYELKFIFGVKLKLLDLLNYFEKSKNAWLFSAESGI